MRLEGNTVVSKGAAQRYIHEKPVPSFRLLRGLSAAKMPEADSGIVPVARGAAAFVALPSITETSNAPELEAEPKFPVHRAGVFPPPTILEGSIETDISSAQPDALLPSTTDAASADVLQPQRDAEPTSVLEVDAAGTDVTSRNASGVVPGDVDATSSRVLLDGSEQV